MTALFDQDCFVKSLETYVDLQSSNETRVSSLNSIVLSGFHALFPYSTLLTRLLLCLLCADAFSGNVDLKMLVQDLEPYLTSQDEDVRARGTLLLVEVLIRVPTLPLTPQMTETLVVFFCDRLLDYPYVFLLHLGLSLFLFPYAIGRKQVISLRYYVSACLPENLIYFGFAILCLCHTAGAGWLAERNVLLLSCVKEVLKGLLALTKNHTVSGVQAQSVLSAYVER